jgi:PKHD-type hydroxylase
MLLHVAEVLSKQEAEDCRALLARGAWTDGSITAGHQSARVKHNRQLPEQDPAAVAVRARVLEALGRHPTFLAAALPRRVFPPLFNRYGEGGHFGAHVDNAVRYPRTGADGEAVRTDVSITLFLGEPQEYDGGELVIEDTFGSHRVKLGAGDLILYPAGSLHAVTPVTRGERWAAFFWVQSLVRSPEQRRLLFELDSAIQSLTQQVPDSPELVRLTGVYHNLLRAWSDV